jgi:hypothetical protein
VTKHAGVASRRADHDADRQLDGADRGRPCRDQCAATDVPEKTAPARITNAGAIRLPKGLGGALGSKAQLAGDVVPIAPFSLRKGTSPDAL